MMSPAQNKIADQTMKLLMKKRQPVTQTEPTPEQTETPAQDAHAEVSRTADRQAYKYRFSRNQRLSFVTTAELRDRLDKKCAEDGMSRNAMINEILSDYLLD